MLAENRKEPQRCSGRSTGNSDLREIVSSGSLVGLLYVLMDESIR
ncbi:protein of unknown function [Streptomyces sp. KY75]|nr:protein of unknown function [Streptomyces sp. KY70]CAD5974748.1 protein of unknown function [Streptomyces sp. KY75]